MGLSDGPATRACRRVSVALFATIAVFGTLWTVAAVAGVLASGSVLIGSPVSWFMPMFIVGHAGVRFRRPPSEEEALRMLGGATGFCVCLGVFAFWGAVALALRGEWWGAVVSASVVPPFAAGFAISASARYQLVPPPAVPEDPVARRKLARAAVSLRLLAAVTVAFLWIAVPRPDAAATIHMVMLSACIVGFLLWLARGVAYGRYLLGAAALAGVYCMMAALFAILGVVGLLGDGEVSLALRALLALAGAANLWAMVFVFAAVGSEPRASAQP